MIPDDVLDEITSRAKAEWPGDEEMQKYLISEECDGYIRLQCIDFGELADLKDEFVKSAREGLDAWNEVCDCVESELTAYRELSGFVVDGILQSVVDDWKAQAKTGNENDYAGQLNFVKSKARKHLSVIATRQQIDPIKGLLIELEEIIGNECYNGNIQNYGSWGELESEGRQFRYPVKFYSESSETKRWKVSRDTPSEELISGYYAFGANELNIYRALFKVVLHLREKYALMV